MAFELKNNIICFDLALLESELQELSLLHRPPEVRFFCEIMYSDPDLKSPNIYVYFGHCKNNPFLKIADKSG